jgi:peptide/nickel transport system substrate-binding protein
MNSKGISKIVIVAIIIAIVAISGIAAYLLYPTSTVNPEAELRVGFQVAFSPTWTDPARGASYPELSVSGYVVHEPLIMSNVVNGVMVYSPSLATSWTMINDTTIELKLRQGVKFQSGVEFTADDVVAFNTKMTNLSYPAGFRTMYLPINTAVKIDNYTVQMSAPTPFAPMVNTLTMSLHGITGSKAMAQYGYDGYLTHPDGTGPYMVTQNDPSVKIVLTRNENYWGVKPKLKTITITPLIDAEARVTALETHQVDYISAVPPQYLDGLRNDGFNVTIVPGARQHYVGMNCLKAPFNDTRVRQAINYAVNVSAIIQTIYMGVVQPVQSVTPSSVLYYKASPIYYYDPVKARALLAEAGYPNGFKCEIWGGTGRALMDREATEAIAGYLREAGIDVTLKLMEYTTYSTQLRNEVTKGYANASYIPQFDMFYLTWAVMTLDPDSGIRTQFYGINNNSNRQMYNNTRVNYLLTQQYQTLNATLRQQECEEAQQIIMNETPWIILWVEPVIVAKSTKVMGDIVDPREYYLLHDAYMSV